MNRDGNRSALSRREALSLLGAGAGLGLAALGREAIGVAAAQAPPTRAAAAAISRGAIIRTIIETLHPTRWAPAPPCFMNTCRPPRVSSPGTPS